MNYSYNTTRVYIQNPHASFSYFALVDIILSLNSLLLVIIIASAGPYRRHFRTSISVLFCSHAFKAVVGTGNALVATDDTLAAKIAKGALIADAYLLGWPHIRVANGTAPVALVTELTDISAGLLVAHNKVDLVARHLALGWW